MRSMYDQSAYQEATRRVRARLGFYQHLAVYLAVNAFLVFIYLVTSWQTGYFSFPWFIFPLGGWGIGIVAHAVSVFLTKTQAEQHMIAAELRRMGVPPSQPSFYPHDGATVPPTAYTTPMHQEQQEQVSV